MAEDDRVEEGSEESQPLPSWEQLWPPISYWSRAAAAVVVVVMAVLALAALRNVLLVVVAAFVIALGLQPALTDMERRGLSPHDRWDAGRHSRRIAGVADRRPGQDLGNGVLDPEADREGQDRKSRR